jgi:hypothetical protein
MISLCSPPGYPAQSLTPSLPIRTQEIAILKYLGGQATILRPQAAAFTYLAGAKGAGSSSSSSSARAGKKARAKASKARAKNK